MLKYVESFYFYTTKQTKIYKNKKGVYIMFCSNCGKNLPEDAKFCNGCGAPINTVIADSQTGITTSAKPNPMFTNFLSVIKGFFSKSPVKVVGESAKSTGMEWIILSAISVVSLALTLEFNAMQLLNSILGSASSLVGGLFKFGPLFLCGLLIGAVTYFLMSGAIFAAMKLIFKKNVNFISVLNLVGAATLPLSCAYIINMLVGFLWVGFIFVFFTVGTVATSVLLYVGIQKLDKLEKSPFWVYNAIWGIAVLVITIIVFIAISIAVKSAIGSALGSLGSMMKMFS